jgi:hypothetical protein
VGPRAGMNGCGKSRPPPGFFNTYTNFIFSTGCEYYTKMVQGHYKINFTACKRSLNATWKSGISGKIHWPFLAHIVPPLATRISGETTGGESWNV